MFNLNLCLALQAFSFFSDLQGTWRTLLLTSLQLNLKYLKTFFSFS